MSRLSGEEMQERMDEYCSDCRFWKIFDKDCGAGECTKDYKVIYDPEENECDCSDKVKAPDLYDEMCVKENSILERMGL